MSSAVCSRASTVLQADNLITRQSRIGDVPCAGGCLGADNAASRGLPGPRSALFQLADCLLCCEFCSRLLHALCWQQQHHMPEATSPTSVPTLVCSELLSIGRLPVSGCLRTVLITAAFADIIKYTS